MVENQAVDVAAVKRDMEKNLSRAWETALKIVDEGERDRVIARLDEAKQSMNEWSEKPADLRVLGGKMSKILFAAFQAGMNVTAIDAAIDDPKEHEVDPDKSNQLYGAMNHEIFQAKAGADSLRMIPLS